MTTLLRITSVIIWDEVSMTKRLRTGGWSLLAVMSD
jgi:hypothetical protein